MTSPNPDWAPGQKIDSPVENMVTINPGEVEPVDMYKLLVGSIVPRPIGFISTISANGVANLAPYSFFNGVSSNPPCVVIGVGKGRAGKDKKDTLSNILETGEFVFNSANPWLIEALVYCAGDFSSDVSEFEQAGLTPLPSQKVAPPRVKESAVHFECKLHKTVEIGDGSPGSSTLVIGEIVLAHVFDRAYKDGKIDFDQIKSVARLGGYEYGLVTERFEIKVPRVSKEEENR